MKKKVKIKSYIVIGIIAIFTIIMSSLYMIRNKKSEQNKEIVMAIETTDIESNTKQLENEVDTSKWDLNKVWIYTDPDGVKVPVPIGFTASGAESEKYVNHNVEKTGTISDLTWSSSGTYPWIQNASNAIWQSGNYNKNNSVSELVSNEIIVGENGGYLSIEWSVSSELNSSYDKTGILWITITDVINGTSTTPYCMAGKKCGTNYNSLVFTKYDKELEEGRYVISIKFEKKSSNGWGYGLDRGYVKSGKFLNYEENGSDKVRIHKAGGLVVYEGTEEVNDENAWSESINRNQFVWIPVDDVNQIREIDTKTGKMKAKLWDFTASGKTAISNGNDDMKQEVGIMKGTQKRNLKFIDSNDEFYKELQSQYLNTISSIEKYGGFYIGRFETSVAYSNPSLESVHKPKVCRLREIASNSFGFYNYYMISTRQISNNDNIQTGMMWGSLFDETFQWLIKTGEKSQAEIAISSFSWGNYTDTVFTHLNKNGVQELKERIEFHTREEIFYQIPEIENCY